MIPVRNIFTDSEIQCIQKEAAAAEKSGKWTPAMLSLARKKRLFQLFVPQKYGGQQLDLPHALHRLEAASWLDGSFGWTLTLGAGAGVFGAFMNPDFAQSVFSDDKAFIAGSGFPGGKAEFNESNYTVNGSWKYASGIEHATLITASCFIAQNGQIIKENDNDKIKAFAFLPREVEITSKWKSFGLKATGSHDFQVKNRTVAKERAFIISGEAAKVNGILYQYPFEPFAQCTLAASLIGMVGRFLKESQQILFSKNGVSQIKNLPPQLQKSLTSGLDQYQEARSSLHEVVQGSWDKLLENGHLTEAQSKKVGRIYRRSCQKALSSIQQIYPLLGMVAIDPSSEVNRFWRDIHTTSQHILLAPTQATG